LKTSTIILLILAGCAALWFLGRGTSAARPPGNSVVQRPASNLWDFLSSATDRVGDFISDKWGADDGGDSSDASDVSDSYATSYAN
jgi:hypothetical protein